MLVAISRTTNGKHELVREAEDWIEADEQYKQRSGSSRIGASRPFAAAPAPASACQTRC